MKANYLARFALLLAMATLSGCATQLVSQYDAETDRELSELQSDVALHIARLQLLAAGPDGRPQVPACRFANFAASYADFAARAHVLAVRNEARWKNELTTAQLQLLSQSIATGLVSAHRDADNQCMTMGALVVAQQILDQQFKSVLTLELAKRNYRGAP